MSPKSPKFKRARAVIEVDAVPIHARWMPVEAAVNSVLAKFGIKTKITLRQETPFLIVEGERRRSPRSRKDQAWESPSSFSCRTLGMAERVHIGDYYQGVGGGLCHSIGSDHEFANKIVRDTKAGGKFYRGLGR